MVGLNSGGLEQPVLVADSSDGGGRIIISQLILFLSSGTYSVAARAPREARSQFVIALQRSQLSGKNRKKIAEIVGSSISRMLARAGAASEIHSISERSFVYSWCTCMF